MPAYTIKVDRRRNGLVVYGAKIENVRELLKGFTEFVDISKIETVGDGGYRALFNFGYNPGDKKKIEDTRRLSELINGFNDGSQQPTLVTEQQQKNDPMARIGAVRGNAAKLSQDMLNKVYGKVFKGAEAPKVAVKQLSVELLIQQESKKIISQFSEELDKINLKPNQRDVYKKRFIDSISAIGQELYAGLKKHHTAERDDFLRGKYAEVLAEELVNSMKVIQHDLAAMKAPPVLARPAVLGKKRNLSPPPPPVPARPDLEKKRRQPPPVPPKRTLQ